MHAPWDARMGQMGIIIKDEFQWMHTWDGAADGARIDRFLGAGGAFVGGPQSSGHGGDSWAQA
jgi:hypothetical protein